MADDDLFPWHAPPPGGLERLRSRLDGRRHSGWLTLTLTAAAVVAALAVVREARAPLPIELDAGLPLGRVLSSGPTDPTTAMGPAVALEDGSVLYRVAGTRREDEP